MVPSKSKRGKGDARGRGRGGNTANSRSRSRAKDSATPAPCANASGRGPLLMLKLKTPAPEVQTHQAVIDDDEQEDLAQGGFGEEQEEAQEEEQEEVLPAAVPSPRRTRGGRVVKPKRFDGFLLGSEMDNQLDSSPANKVDDDKADGGAEYRNLQSSPPTPSVLTLQRQQQTTPRKSGRSRKSTAASLNTPDSLYPGYPYSSSSTIAPSSPRRPAPDLTPDPAVYSILQSLSSSARTAIELPEISEQDAPDKEKSYSATFLMHLYIVAYKASLWSLCDLVADTWIRAFHALRRLAEKQGKEELELWRPNKGLMTRRPRGYAEPKEYGAKLRTEDPLLDDDVTDFDPDLLRLLYQSTAAGCGARMLWADSMALAGSKLEHVMGRKKGRDEKWHPDLVYDIMLTGLRMCRRKLTLKIEETTEGAWCKRYHEHAKHGLRCYRETAAMQEPESSDEDEPDPLTRQLEDEGMWTDGGHAKQVHFSGVEDQEMVDLDAEGDSDDE